MSEHIAIVDLSEQERDDWFEKHGCDITRKLHEERKKSGYYDVCRRDGCKELRDKQERTNKDEQKRTHDHIGILTQHGKEQEQKVADLTKQLAEQQQKFIDYQLQTEERFNKLALLLQQGLPQAPPPEPAPLQAPPPLQSSKSLRQKSILPK